MISGYQHLTAAERVTLMVMKAEGESQRAIAAHLGRSSSTISRELARNRSGSGCYDGVLADERARALRQAPGLHPKLSPQTPVSAMSSGRGARVHRTGVYR